jgi:type 1 glutamine amidotransferase
MTHTKKALAFACVAALLIFAQSGRAAEPAAKPLRAVLILAGCCHDYAKQKDILKEGIEKRANVQVDIVYTTDTTTRARFDLYAKPDWAKGYDVAIHDECSADVTDTNYVNNVLAAHKTIPAVNLHCAMHSYRWGKFQQPVKLGDDNSHWYEMIGLQSTGHGPQRPIEITFTNLAHPVVKGLANWTTINEELYNNIQVFGTATPLAWGKQNTGSRTNDFVVAWANDYHGTRIFSTTIGHNNATVADDRYLDLVTRGLLWSCGKLDESGKPKPGYEASIKK